MTMSKFAYKAEGELNSQYLLDLLKEYLSQLLVSNDNNGIVDDNYKINPNATRFKQWFNDVTKRLFKSKDSLENYNKILTTKYISAILDKIEIFLKTNVLSPKDFFELKCTLQSIKFDNVLPLLDEYRDRAIRTSQKTFLNALNDVKYLKYAKSNYILYNSPVQELKPFLSDKVSSHIISYIELQKLIKQFVTLRYNELTTFDFEDYEPKFKTSYEDFYKDKITDSGIGEEVEEFIRSKMLEKLEILKHEEVLPEGLQNKVNEIDNLLKQLKLGKIEKMLEELVKLKTNLAHAKEVIDNCKDTINSTTIPNKSQIFLSMDNLYYRLSQKCEKLEQKAKLKLQLVDKVKMFNMLELLQSQQNNDYESVEEKGRTLPKPPRKQALSTKKMQNRDFLDDVEETKTESKPHIASNLYDDDEISEIHITEDDGDTQAEDEIVIDEE